MVHEQSSEIFGKAVALGSVLLSVPTFTMAAMAAKSVQSPSKSLSLSVVGDGFATDAADRGATLSLFFSMLPREAPRDYWSDHPGVRGLYTSVVL